MKLKLIRDVPISECPWLERSLKTGDVVYEYTGATYGCIASGIACTQEPNKTPFFEVPRNALDFAHTR